MKLEIRQPVIWKSELISAETTADFFAHEMEFNSL